MRCLALAAVAGCVSPPASSEACRADISVASANTTLLWLAQQTHDFRVRVLSHTFDPRESWGTVLRGPVAMGLDKRDSAIERCISDHWPRAFLRCYVESDDPWPCARRDLPQEQCLALQHALFGMIDHDGGGRCGEPGRRFF